MITAADFIEEFDGYRVGEPPYTHRAVFGKDGRTYAAFWGAESAESGEAEARAVADEIGVPVHYQELDELARWASNAAPVRRDRTVAPKGWSTAQPSSQDSSVS